MPDPPIISPLDNLSQTDRLEFIYVRWIQVASIFFTISIALYVFHRTRAGNLMSIVLMALSLITLLLIIALYLQEKWILESMGYQVGIRSDIMWIIGIIAFVSILWFFIQIIPQSMIYPWNIGIYHPYNLPRFT